MNADGSASRVASPSTARYSTAPGLVARRPAGSPTRRASSAQFDIWLDRPRDRRNQRARSSPTRGATRDASWAPNSRQARRSASRRTRPGGPVRDRHQRERTSGASRPRAPGRITSPAWGPFRALAVQRCAKRAKYRPRLGGRSAMSRGDEDADQAVDRITGPPGPGERGARGRRVRGPARHRLRHAGGVPQGLEYAVTDLDARRSGKGSIDERRSRGRSAHAKIESAASSRSPALEGRLEVARSTASPRRRSRRRGPHELDAAQTGADVADPEPGEEPIPAGEDAAVSEGQVAGTGGLPRGVRCPGARGAPRPSALTSSPSSCRSYAASDYADDATYWLADCYFKQGRLLELPILRFDDVANGSTRSGNKAPDALCTDKGEALLRMGHGKAAGNVREGAPGLPGFVTRHRSQATSYDLLKSGLGQGRGRPRERRGSPSGTHTGIDRLESRAHRSGGRS